MLVRHGSSALVQLILSHQGTEEGFHGGDFVWGYCFPALAGWAERRGYALAGVLDEERSEVREQP